MEKGIRKKLYITFIVLMVIAFILLVVGMIDYYPELYGQAALVLIINGLVILGCILRNNYTIDLMKGSKNTFFLIISLMIFLISCIFYALFCENFYWVEIHDEYYDYRIVVALILNFIALIIFYLHFERNLFIDKDKISIKKPHISLFITPLLNTYTFSFDELKSCNCSKNTITINDKNNRFYTIRFLENAEEITNYINGKIKEANK